MGTFLIWIIGSFLVGFVGKGRKIGYGGAFLFSLLLSPVIGLIIALVSKEDGVEQREQEMLVLQRQQAELLKNMQAPSATVEAQPLGLPTDPDARAARLKDLRDRGVITQDEFLKLVG